MPQTIYFTPDLNLPFGSEPDSLTEELVDSVMDSIEWSWFSESGLDPSWGSELGLDPNWDSDVAMMEQSNDLDWETFGRGLFGDVLADEGNIGYDEEMSIAENARVVLPSASKVVIENLDSVVITQQDVDNDDVTCAVCTDDMNVGQIGKQLPCSHRYHGDCIVSWLVMRNTCPVCRFEFPTDDL